MQHLLPEWRGAAGQWCASSCLPGQAARPHHPQLLTSAHLAPLAAGIESGGFLVVRDYMCQMVWTSNPAGCDPPLNPKPSPPPPCNPPSPKRPRSPPPSPRNPPPCKSPPPPLKLRSPPPSPVKSPPPSSPPPCKSPPPAKAKSPPPCASPPPAAKPKPSPTPSPAGPVQETTCPAGSQSLQPYDQCGGINCNGFPFFTKNMKCSDNEYTGGHCLPAPTARQQLLPAAYIDLLLNICTLFLLPDAPAVHHPLICNACTGAIASAAY
jgi:hypothetical protein